MGEYQILFLSGAPNLSDPRYARELAGLLGLNWRNAALLTVYFVILVALAVRALAWSTKDFSDWQAPTAVGWSIAGALAVASALALWRLAAEEGPHLAYGMSPEAYASLKPVRGIVTGRGWSVAMGAPFGARRIYWRTAEHALSGATPYLPERVARAVKEGSGVWIGYDSAGKRPPLFLGFGE